MKIKNVVFGSLLVGLLAVSAGAAANGDTGVGNSGNTGANVGSGNATGANVGHG